MKFLVKIDKSMRAVTINCEFSLPRLNACTGANPVDALKVQSSKSSTKVSRDQVQLRLLSEGLTRGLGVRLTCRSMHFRSLEYQNNSTTL